MLNGEVTGPKGAIGYTPTEYGLKVHLRPHDFSDVDLVGGLTESPVVLMRIPAVKKADEVTVRIPEEDLVAEPKFDGWLAELVSGKIYSRRGEDLTGKIPKLTESYREQIPGKHHMVAELIYVSNKRQLQNVVTSICGTKDDDKASEKADIMEGSGRFKLVVFDVLANPKNISGRPFSYRREELEKYNLSGRLFMPPQAPFSKWKLVYATSIRSGGEGVVFKNINAPFPWKPMPAREPKPQGIAYKLKREQSDDFIVFSTFRTAKDTLMLRFGQLHNGRIVEVGKVNNLSEENTEEADRLMSEGPFVIEIGYQARSADFPGKLRSPKFLRFRPDKPMESATMPKGITQP